MLVLTRYSLFWLLKSVLRTLVAMIVLLMLAVPSQAEQPKSESQDKITMDFHDADITMVIKFISELIGKNIIIDKAVKGNVTIMSPTPVSVGEAYKVFESVLDVHGFAAVRSGDIIKIVPAVQAHSMDVETRFSPSADHDDRMVTQVVPLQYADPEDLKRVFSPLVSKSSIIVAYSPTNTLIVTDVLSNINRLLDIVKIIDAPGLAKRLEVLSLRHASAGHLVKVLGPLFQSVARDPKSQGPSSPVSIMADERTNSLMVLATKEDIEMVKEMVATLDQELPRGEGDIHVYYLQNAKAEELAKELTSLPGDAPAKGDKIESPREPSLSSDIRIQADMATNSLIITAKKADYLVLEDVIKKLDIPRKMVYIEALIMEVNVSKDLRIGMETRGGADFNDGKAASFGGFGSLTDYANLNGLTTKGLPGGFSLGVLGREISINGKNFLSLGAVFQALKSDSDVEIISAPQLLTTDNHEAQIKVGENVPYLTTEETSINAATTDRVFNNYEYRDVGVTMKITPQINQEGVVRLNLFQEVIKLKSGSETYRPTTLKRSAETTVMVRDKNTIVIGGIIGEDTDNGISKVPGLGDVPIVGWLFKGKKQISNKTNLFIFITPYIIENPADAEKIFRERREHMDGLSESGATGSTDLTNRRILTPGLRYNSANEGAGSPDLSDEQRRSCRRLTDRGYRAIRDGDFYAAEKYIKDALALAPEDPFALINMGVIHESRGEWLDAAKRYEQAIPKGRGETAGVSTEQELQGLRLSEIARRNMEKLEARLPADPNRQSAPGAVVSSGSQ
ncbi:MAG: type II secretion system secretin GspD [Proteobacteria bacterium]|nr:type II secretion system protein GspD [Desulfobulbaceae bacterium]MBU4154048.1 type II secretion system secretin GspD [Pseudomonadota bacterium]